jgi:endonuclease/exonuclease/phosphatase family metal-dependent hydrolase
MRLFSYNVLDGGEGRADPLAEVIEAQRADVVALIEADNTDVIERISKRLAMDYVRAEGKEHAVCLLSRWPIVETVNHAALRNDVPCLLEALARDPSGTEWPIGVLHLTPHAREGDERQRETEIGGVLEVFACHRAARRPHLLVGDFNANSPVQRIDPGMLYPKSKQAWDENGGQIPRRVIQKVLDEGYLDSLHAGRADYASTHGTFTTQYPGQRLDFIFTHSLDSSRIRSAWIEYDRLAKYASDHFPIGVEIA